MIRRPPRSTQGVSSAASDVYKRQARSCPRFRFRTFWTAVNYTCRSKKMETKNAVLGYAPPALGQPRFLSVLACIPAGWLPVNWLSSSTHGRQTGWMGCLAGFVAGGWLPVCLWIKQGVSCSPGWVGSLAGCSRGWLAGFVAARGLMGGQPSHWHSGGHRDRNRHGNRGSANRACDTSGRRRNNNDNNVDGNE